MMDNGDLSPLSRTFVMHLAGFFEHIRMNGRAL